MNEACLVAMLLVNFGRHRVLGGGNVHRHKVRTIWLPSRASSARAFTMIDVLTSISVIMVLIAILLPSLTIVRETARRVVCGSNVRQIGLGLAMYADDYDEFLPPSRFGSPSQDAVHQSTLVRALVPAQATGESIWDGIGILYQADYLVAPGVFYCPSHHGEHPFAIYAAQWPAPGTEIIANYQFRVGVGNQLATLGGRAVISDSLRTQADFNHKIGCNFLRGDLSATWYSDSSRSLISELPANESDIEAAARVADAWEFLDGIDGNGGPR